MLNHASPNVSGCTWHVNTWLVHIYNVHAWEKYITGRYINTHQREREGKSLMLAQECRIHIWEAPKLHTHSSTSNWWSSELNKQWCYIWKILSHVLINNVYDDNITTRYVIKIPNELQRSHFMSEFWTLIEATSISVCWFCFLCWQFLIQNSVQKSHYKLLVNGNCMSQNKSQFYWWNVILNSNIIPKQLKFAKYGWPLVSEYICLLG